MDIYIFYFINLSKNNILEALKHKNNDEVINFYNYNKLNISLSRYNRENKPKIYKNIVKFENCFHTIFNTNYFSISFKLQSIDFNKSQIEYIYKLFDFFRPKETVKIIKIFYKKDLSYIADNEGKGIIQKYCPINESLKNEFLQVKIYTKSELKLVNREIFFSFTNPLLKSLFFHWQFSIPIILNIQPEIISDNNISNDFNNKKNNELNLKQLPTSEEIPEKIISKRKFEIINKFVNNKLDYFTSKDIQDQNKEITRIFQKEALEFIDDDEKEENEKIGKFLKTVAFISRKAYNISNELFKEMFEEFSESTKENKTISTFEKDEKLKKKFSSWVKEYEKDSEGNKNYENYFRSCKDKNKDLFDDNITYLFTLFSQLITLYFHCELSFPNVDVNFNSEQIFNNEKMIDFINKGKNRKVNFVILPSLFSNGNYLDNGKLWVFTYKKKTFKFDNLNFENLVDKQKKFLLDK